jgi:NADH:ubiquinone reductase (H+-translocating)
MSQDTRPTPHRVVIVGAGFGGLTCAHELARAPVEVTVIDRQNHHLFQPLLYQVATAALSPAEIAAPIRSILRDQKNTRVVLDTVTGVDTSHRIVLTASGARIGFDTLVIATGARHGYFGHEEWAANAPGIKTIDDATAVRRKILLAFEKAEQAEDEATRDAWLTFVVVGAGPTGVEMAGAIAELAHNSICADFRRIKPRSAKVILVEAGDRLLATFPPDLSEAAKKALEKLHVEVRLKAKVEDVRAEGAMINGEFLPCRTTIWAAGVRASPAGEWLGATCDRVGRVAVDADFQVPGKDGIHVIGDTAAYTLAKTGKLLPGIAPAAKQSGRHVARLIAARVGAGRPPPPFAYADFGNLATIGRQEAVVQMGRLHLTGFIAWLLWSVAHVYFLIGFRNRFIVAASWMWSYLTYQRGVRLITGSTLDQSPEKKEAA